MKGLLHSLQRLVGNRDAGSNCLVLALLTLPFLLLFWCMQAWALFVSPAALTFYRPTALLMTELQLAAAIATLFAAALLSRHGDHRRLEWITTTALFYICTWLAVGYGLKDTPMGLLLIGLLLIARAFFSLPTLMPALVLCVAMIGGGELLTDLGWLPYAPVLAHPVFTGPRLGWWWDIWMRVITDVAEVYFAVMTFFLFSVLQRQDTEMEVLVRTDALTGLLNRRTFMGHLEQEAARQLRYGQPVCLVMCDLDHFKQVNDNYGHAAGDQVLAWFGEHLRQCLRQDIDSAGRYGGEEFIVLLPETDLAGARVLAERIRTGLTGQVFRCDGHEFPMTVSIGIAAMTQGDAGSALRDADRTLYQAKHGGRNRIIVAGDMAPA